jgi:hypothetical protein
MALQFFCWTLAAFQFRNLFYTGSWTPWTSDQPVARPLPKYRTTQTQNKRTQIPTPWVGFEPTITAFERTKTVHALDHAAAEIDKIILSTCFNLKARLSVWPLQAARHVLRCSWQKSVGYSALTSSWHLISRLSNSASANVICIWRH